MDKAWIVVSENRIVGTERKSNDFFASIANIYNETFKTSSRQSRTGESVKARCKAIKKEYMYFSGGYARVEHFKPNGVSSDDMIRISTCLFNGIDMRRVDDDCGKPFCLLQAWDLLRNHAQFMSALNLSPKAHTSDPDILSKVNGSRN